jgi:hypothetical protein
VTEPLSATIVMPLRGDRPGLGGDRPQAKGLRDVGCDARDVADAGVTGDEAIVWMSGNPGWYPRTLERLLASRPASRPFVVVWHSEPLPLPAGAPFGRERLSARELAKIALRDSRATDPYTNSRTLRRLAGSGLPDLLVVNSRDMAEHLAEHGIDSEVVPLGYDDALVGRDLGLERDIDVLFLGALDVPRRRRILRRLRRAGLAVEAVGDWHDPAYWGENRMRLLNRVRILVNVSRFPGQSAGYRLILGLANGALTISEPIYRPEPFVPGEHFVSVETAEMPIAVARYLADEDARRAIVARGRELIRNELTMERSVSRVLSLIRAHPRGARL